MGRHNPQRPAGRPAAAGTEDEEVLSKEVLADCRELLRSLGQTVKLTTLYKRDHPVAAASRQQSWKKLKDLVADIPARELHLALVEGRWLVNDAVLGDASQVSDVLLGSFRTHGLHGITFAGNPLLHELSALCELASVPPKNAGDVDAADFLKQKGVRNIRIDVEQYARAEKTRRPPPIKNPIQRRGVRRPAPKTRPASALRPLTRAGNGKSAGTGIGTGTRPGTGTSTGGGFGKFIKDLVEKSVAAPAERAAIYSDTIRMVRNSLERRVGEQTKKFKARATVALNERIRTEHVMESVAQGKIVVDQEGRVLNMDAASEKILGKRLVEVAGTPILEHINSDEQIAALAEDITVSSENPISGEVQIGADNEVMDAFRQSMALLHDEEGRVVGTYGVLPHLAKFKEAMKMQEDFVSHVTHELKAPLTSICSALEIINNMAGKNLGAEEKKFLDISRRNSLRLRDMINELLDFSKIQSGRMSVKPERCAIESILTDAVDGLKPWANAKEIRLEHHVESPTHAPPGVLADSGRIVQVLTNLISNAIKNTPAKGHVLVLALPGVGENNGEVVFSVQDTGCGISREDQKRIFQKFVQVGNTAKYREGVGLGLRIAQELIERHNGRIWVESEKDKGATFYFTLPATPPPK